MKPPVRTLGLITIIVWFIGCTTPGKNAFARERSLQGKMEQNFQEAAAQYKELMKRLPPGRFPKTYYVGKDQLETSGSDWWCSGFYPGSLWYLFEQTGDSALYYEALRKQELLKKEQYNTSTHDLGFMMYCSFGNAARIAPGRSTKKYY
jgi:unsaturated chondroitin disaccharide hydrolase